MKTEHQCPVCVRVMLPLENGDEHCDQCGRDWYPVESEGEWTLASRRRSVRLARMPAEGDRLDDVIRSHHDCLRHFDPVTLVMAATRYFLGRATGLTHTFIGELLHAWPELPQTTRLFVRESVEEAFDRDDRARLNGGARAHFPLGQDCDRQAWETVRALWRETTGETNENDK